MLDQNDLTAIGNLIKAGNDSIKKELRQEISAGNDSIKQELRTEIAGVKQELRREIKEGNESVKQELKTEFSKQLKKEINPLKKDIKKIKSDIETVISFFDKETLKLGKRVTRVENHLGLPLISISP